MRFPCPLMSFALGSLTLPLLGLLMGWQKIKQQAPSCDPDSSWWWGEERLPPLYGEINVKR